MLLAYNGNYQITQIKNWQYDSLEIWVLYNRKTDYAYDSNGNMLYYLEQVGNDVLGWSNFSRNTYTYDGANHPLSYVYEIWDGANWILDYSVNWVYDANGNELSMSYGVLQYLYTYNAQNLLASAVRQILENGNWVNQYRELYTYFPGDTKLENTTTFNWMNSSWEKSVRTSYSYDSNEDLVVTLSEGWDGTFWVNFIQELFSYDGNHNKTYSLDKLWVNDFWENTSQQFNSFDDQNNLLHSRIDTWVDNSWKAQHVFHNYYTEFVSTQNPILDNFKIYPNPAANVITLQGEDLSQAQVIGPKGQILQTNQLKNQTETTFQIDKLPNGFYFIKVLDTNGKIGVKSIFINH